MNKQPSNTEEKPSIQKQGGAWLSIKRFLCPCILPSAQKHSLSPQRNSSEPMDEPQSLKSSQNSQSRKNKKSSTNSGGKDRKNAKPTLHQKLILEMQLKRQTLLNYNDKKQYNQQRSQILGREKKPSRRSVGNLMREYPICGYHQNQLISVGINHRHILIQIASIHLSPNPASLKKQLAQSKPHKGKQTASSNNLDKYWVQRYALFQRFDEGIKLDDPSWARTPPGPVCEWIAGKCGQAKLIVDAFAGVGATTIRIANSPRCMKVIANDWNGRRLQCLLNNSKVYDVDRCIQLSQNDFLQLNQKGVEVVFAQPPVDEQMRTTSTGCLSIVDFTPTLDKIISKALLLANNIILLLPAATSIDVLCSCLNKCATQLGKMKGICSTKLEKIYYQGQLKYILVTVGRMVQDQIKLSHQLNFIYAKLQQPQKTAFYYKKLVKAIREEYGMIYLLNIVKESQKKFKEKKNKEGKKIVDAFICLIRARKLIPQEKLERLLTQHETSMERNRKSQTELNVSKESGDGIPLESILESVIEEQKVNDEVPFFRMSEQTQSQESHYSYLQNFQRPTNSSRTPRVFTESSGSIIIKRTLNQSIQKRSLSPGNRTNSPTTPTHKLKSQIATNQRASHIVKKHKYEKDKDSPTIRKSSQIITTKNKNDKTIKKNTEV